MHDPPVPTSLLEAIGKKPNGDTRIEAWKVLHNNEQVDDVCQTVAVSFLGRHAATVLMPRSYWGKAGRRAALDIIRKRHGEMPLLDGVDRLVFDDADTTLLLRELMRHVEHRKVVALAFRQYGGELLSNRDRARLHKGRVRIHEWLEHELKPLDCARTHFPWRHLLDTTIVDYYNKVL